MKKTSKTYFPILLSVPNLRCPYQAIVIKLLETNSNKTLNTPLLIRFKKKPAAKVVKKTYLC